MSDTQAEQIIKELERIGNALALNNIVLGKFFTNLFSFIQEKKEQQNEISQHSKTKAETRGNFNRVSVSYSHTDDGHLSHYQKNLISSSFNVTKSKNLTEREVK